MESDEEQKSVESRVAPPDLSCPKCNGLLPSKLGKIRCVLCDVEVNVEHKSPEKSGLKKKFLVQHAQQFSLQELMTAHAI